MRSGAKAGGVNPRPIIRSETEQRTAAECLTVVPAPGSDGWSDSRSPVCGVFGQAKVAVWCAEQGTVSWTAPGQSVQREEMVAGPIIETVCESWVPAEPLTVEVALELTQFGRMMSRISCSGASRVGTASRLWRRELCP